MDKINKFLAKLNPAERLIILGIVNDVAGLKVVNYDIKPLKGFFDIYRLRKGKIRIIFRRDRLKGVVLKIAYRGDVYRGL